MTTYAGKETSYSNTLVRKTMITDRIIMADPYDIVAITVLGLNNESKFAFVNTPGRTYTWLEDAYPAQYDATNEADIATTTNTTVMTVVNGALFHVGDIIQLDSEYVYVASISGNEVTVTRGYASTTIATHATTSTAYIRYNARVEGAESSDSPWTEVATHSNYSTIFHKEVKITRDDMLFPNYGIDNLRTYRIDKNMDVLMMQLCKLAYYGKSAVGTVSASRSSAGLIEMVTTNATPLAGATLLRSHIDTEFMQIQAAGGKTDLILCDAWFQKKINDFYEGFVTTERSETIGGMMIKQLMHPITGDLVRVVVDRLCPSGYAFMLDTRYVGYITIDPFFYEPLAKTGDYETGQTIGEYGFVAAATKFHSILSGYSTSA